jgi:hypothetical protein
MRAVLYIQARISAMDAMAAVPDSLLGVLFMVAFWKTTTSDGLDSNQRRRA